jgi:hypothetical protein
MNRENVSSNITFKLASGIDMEEVAQYYHSRHVIGYVMETIKKFVKIVYIKVIIINKYMYIKLE